MVQKVADAAELRLSSQGGLTMWSYEKRKEGRTLAPLSVLVESS